VEMIRGESLYQSIADRPKEARPESVVQPRIAAPKPLGLPPVFLIPPMLDHSPRSHLREPREQQLRAFRLLPVRLGICDICISTCFVQATPRVCN